MDNLTLQFQQMLNRAVQFLPRLIVALVIFAATFPLSGLVARWVKRVSTARTEDPETLQLLSRLARWTVIILGTLVALDQVNFDVTGFVAGLGIAAFTIGFALQDIARNFVAGILLLVQQPFNLGQAIKVSGYTGTVLEISIRDTVIKTFDGELVILPNADVYTNAITNYSAQTVRRRNVSIGLGYQEDVGRAVQLFLDTMAAVDGVLEEPAPVVMVDKLGDSAVMLEAYFWVDQAASKLLEVHSAVVIGIKEAAEREGIDLPYPTQTVRLERESPEN